MSEFEELLKWAATAFITLSAIQVSFSVRWSTEWWAYVGFLIGHILWSFAAVWMQEWALLFLNASFILVDSYAIYIRINKPIGEQDGNNSNTETG